MILKILVNLEIVILASRICRQNGLQSCRNALLAAQTAAFWLRTFYYIRTFYIGLISITPLLIKVYFALLFFYSFISCN